MQTNHQTSYEDVIKAPMSDVWKALTEPELVKQYFFGSEQETNWQVSSPITWTGEYEGKTYVDKGVVLEYAPNERLTYSYLSSWSGRDDKPENYLRISYEVKEYRKVHCFLLRNRIMMKKRHSILLMDGER